MYTGGVGDDAIFGRNGGDILYGGSGIDTMYGSRGIDMIYGGLGDDVIAGGGRNVGFYLIYCDLEFLYVTICKHFECVLWN